MASDSRNHWLNGSPFLFLSKHFQLNLLAQKMMLKERKQQIMQNQISWEVAYVFNNVSRVGGVWRELYWD